MKINLSEWLVLIRPEVAGFEVTGDTALTPDGRLPYKTRK